MTGSDPELRRILIGAASFADAESALRIAERIALPLAEIGGLMIEDTALADLAGHPGHRVVTPSGALVAPPSAQELRLLLASQARAFEAQLSRLAAARALRWSFERHAGDLIAGVCAAAKGWDVLVVGQRRFHRRPGPVQAILPPPGAASAATPLAEALAHALQTTVAPLPADLPEAALLERISRSSASVLIVDMTAGPLRTEAQLRHLIEAARCPVLVLGAAHLARH